MGMLEKNWSALTVLIFALCIVGFVAVEGKPSAPASSPGQKLDQIEGQLDELQRSLEVAQRTRSKNLGDLRSSLEGLRRGLEMATSESACWVGQDFFQGRRETVVFVAGTWLRFLEVPAPEGPVVVGLEEAHAELLYQQAQAQVGISEPLLPTIFRSVPNVTREVETFLLQDRPVAEKLLQSLKLAVQPGRVSLIQAESAIAELNHLCNGKVRFDLPTEFELLVAGREVFDHREDLLRPCQEIADLAKRGHHAGLLAHGWQLTKSACEPLGGKTIEACSKGTFVIKGGTRGSQNPLECLPEYRDALPPKTTAVDTILRLVIRS